MLEKLGIYGMEKVETAILAGLVTGDPVLLIGSHGSGKTLLCSRLAQALGLNFWAYDAGKALFEDVLGFPNPASLSSGQVEYIPTPISIWGKEFVLIDELSRANPAMQNKWLEVIRSRRIMGKEIDGLKYLFAAMNPPSYLGAHPLDAALAGRFALIVPVPEAGEMPEQAVAQILTQVSEDDAPMLQASRRDPQDLDLPGFLAACRTRLSAFPAELRERLSRYVLSVSRFLSSREIPLDGRRLGMIWRALQAHLTVEMEKNGTAESLLPSLQAMLLESLSFTLPFSAQGENFPGIAVKAAHAYAWSGWNGTPVRPIVILSAKPVQAVDDFLTHFDRLLQEERKAAITRFISRGRSETEPEQKAAALAAMLKLVDAVCEGSLPLEPDDQSRILHFFLKMSQMQGEDCSQAFSVLNETAEDQQHLDCRAGATILAFRFSFHGSPASRRRNRQHFPDAKDVGNLTAALAEQLRR